MTDLTQPAEYDGAADPIQAAHAWAKSAPRPWIVDGVDIAGVFTELDTTDVNGFAYDSVATTGLDAVLDGGEAYAYGWFCRDTPTTVTLPASSTVIVYVGWNVDAMLGVDEAPADSENIIVGLDAAFASEDPQIPVWEFTTDTTSITEDADVRPLDRLFDDDGLLADTIDAPAELDGFADAPLRINSQTAYSEFAEYATIYNNGGAGWRFRDGTGIGDALIIDNTTGNAQIPHGHLRFRVENRTDDPSSPQAGREWLRTDL